MLHEFLAVNREELIGRCRVKGSRRESPEPGAAPLDYGVPLFLAQLIETLRGEQEEEDRAPAYKRAFAEESSRTAGLHGRELLALGYTVAQVVHGYGDICQSVTELAVERSAPITVEEFHTFNRMLDNAIADAVAAHGHHRDKSEADRGAADLHARLGALADEQRALLETALQAIAALKAGHAGLRGATGAVLEDSLARLRLLIDRSLPELRLGTGMTAAAKR
jgi:hypothetical protein